ncbi:MAG: DUF1194 domain-containing protein [Pseudomonadota bacterium]
MIKRIIPHLILCCVLVLSTKPARAAEPVDVLLLMAIDASASVTQKVLDSQIEGHAAAFRDPLVQSALRSGPHGQIGVALMLWSNPTDTNLAIPWRVLRQPEDARRLARDITALPRDERAGSTGLGAALVAGARHIRRAPYRSLRQIIDVSSNGFSNIGPRPELIKPDLYAAGIEVNAIVIVDEYTWLERYFSESVVTGPAPFVMPAGGIEDYADAILRKLIRELSYRPSSHGLRTRS